MPARRAGALRALRRRAPFYRPDDSEAVQQARLEAIRRDRGEGDRRGSRDDVGMVKLDEHATVPKLDRAARARVTSALDADGVVAAMVFGSQARGRAGPLSDVDLAVWLDPALSRSERHARRLDLIVAAARALGSDELDLVVLNDATPLLRHRVRRDGQCLLDRDPRTRVRLEARALTEYLDTAPLRATLAAGVRHRIEEGRFGGP